MTELNVPKLNVPNLDLMSIANELEAALHDRQAFAPLSDRYGLNIEQAYRVQQHWLELRLAHGDRVLGRKIGLTSKAVRQQFGVDEPDFGVLWGSRQYEFKGGRLELPSDVFIQPRLEGELAFLIGRTLEGPDLSAQQVLAATEAIAPAVEIVDSRISDYKIKITDTVADNASFGGFAVGPWNKAALETDLRLIGMLVSHNREPSVEGIGAASLGHPARAVAWLVNTIHRYGARLEPGDIVMSGALGRMLPAKAGDTFRLEFAGMTALSARFV